jgi:twitching motility protein PilU
MDKSKPVIFEYLESLVRYQASDLYLTAGFVPSLRHDGYAEEQQSFIALGSKPLSKDDINDILNAVLTAKHKREFEQNNELNMALDLGDHGRFRVNVFRQRQAPGLVIRLIKSKVPDFKALNLPTILEDLSLQKRGMILITGMTGSGKSTTASAMVDYRNQNQEGHIITIEDPIEFYHEHKKSIITQREVGGDTESFAVAIKNAMRQRPDVIFIGETREREVMDSTLAAAETGHLCITTLHTANSYQAIERLINMFPEEYHQQVRMNLAFNLKGIIAQRLLPAISGGVVPAVEVLLNQGFVTKLIMNGDIHQIKEVMEQNVAQGMTTFDESILNLYMRGDVTEETVGLMANPFGINRFSASIART